MIRLVHLVWAPLGPAPLIEFARAYRAHPAGADHRLLVVYNGFAGEAERAAYQPLLAGIEHDEMVMPAPTQDIPAYLEAARLHPCEFMCFLNSYSTPLVEGWLALLHEHARRPGVGLVGATGSWESYFSNFADSVAPWHGFAMHVAGSWVKRRRRAGIRAYLGRRRELRRVRAGFPPFPNPHVRSNSFMVRRDTLVRLRTTRIVSKLDALAFESGRTGMTRQVQAMGLHALVVGRDGRGYPPEEWPRSHTFRGGEHENLLVSDNRTREYLALAPAERAAVRRRTWGAA